MKKFSYLLISGLFAISFIIFTIVFKTVDVTYLPVSNTYLGLSHFNIDFSNYVISTEKYTDFAKISDLFLYLSFAFTLVMGVIGVIQWIKNKSLLKVDKRLFILLGGYVALVAIYFIFEVMKLNYSPDLSKGLKASYPSTHVFIGSSLFLMNSYVSLKLLNSEKKWLSYLIYASTLLICLLIVFSRSMALKHWLTDIIGSILLTGFIYFLFIHVNHALIKEEE